jgi:hypothetical protein
MAVGVASGPCCGFVFGQVVAFEHMTLVQEMPLRSTVSMRRDAPRLSAATASCRTCVGTGESRRAAEEHVSGDAGEAVEIGDAHGSRFLWKT